MDEKKTCATPEEAYARWRSSLEKHGLTTDDMVAHFRSIGMTEYADDLQSLILNMEAVVSTNP